MLGAVDKCVIKGLGFKSGLH